MVNLKNHSLVHYCEKLISSIPQKNYVLAYSGGIDSSVLIDCFCKLKNILDINIRSIHINHGLSDRANAFEKHCINTAKLYNLEHIAIQININSKSNIEEKCRLERYKTLVENCKDDEVIVTAHHEDDQIETLFLRLLRGSGSRGLSCMNMFSNFENKTIFRPFLQSSKKSINEYQKQHNVLFIDDITNKDDKFDRNFIRNNLIPLLKNRWPSMNKNIVNNILVQDMQAKFISDNIHDILSKYVDGKYLYIDKLINENNHIKSVILHEWVYLKTKVLLNSKQINEIIKIMNTDNDSNPIFQFKGIIITKDKNILNLKFTGI